MSISNSDVFLAVARRAGLPSRHLINLENLDLSGEWGATYSKLEAKIGTGFIVVMLGPRGTGKTELAVRLASKVVRDELALHYSQQRREVLYIKAMDIFREIRDSFGAGGSETRTIAKFTKPAMLIIDEAHERGNTEAEGRALTNIIDKRYDSLKDTIIIANQSKDDFAKTIGPSVVSRVHETGEAIECNWKSYRVKK